jgi:hypothetical protein
VVCEKFVAHFMFQMCDPFRVVVVGALIFVSLYDINGRLLYHHPIFNNEDQLVVSTKDLISGVYFVTLRVDGKRQSTCKLTIIK